ncbi:DUF2971 domain-containing protein [Corallococcus sp. CA054B]|uniref:DUF2971 domain-containing protein n=1 Tax=Corallococcus sp. CA054B TaxID=2316734 RepID=UPI000EA0B86E|nr:DUF2971 domain-containing protein [Corallococcus sp. CA054B]RKG69839.1 DUF2971 domain-containing protein [Corallococcus sp. CA054B]
MFDHEAYLEAELLNAPRQLSNHLFHYTNAEAAIFGILRSGTLRLSPFESTNDLWESRPLYPSLTLHADDRRLDAGMEVWNELDRSIRIHAKVACLTQDWELPRSVLNPDALRGWNHLSIWAHYGARHSGVCLQFDRNRLIEAFTTALVPGALLRFHGPVVYRSASVGAGLDGVNVGQIREFGLDAVAINYAETHHDQIFFRKHADWSNESEYRLVLIDQSVLPIEFSIREALTGVFLGDAFPSSRLPALSATLKAYPSVKVFHLRYHNRHLGCFPSIAPGTTDAAVTNSLLASHNRSGTLDERRTALKDSVRTASQQRERAAALCSTHLDTLKKAVEKAGASVLSWPKVEVEVHKNTAAIPDNQRSRAPGVPGEQIYFESGYMCVIENVPKHTHTLVAAIAMQVLNGDHIRIHGVVKTEHWKPNGNEHVEQWRETYEVPLTETATALGSIITKIHDTLKASRSDFDKKRGLQSKTST